MKDAIERFHLVFLQALGAKLDKSLFAIKGGCNLRFNFQSLRYSEDLDLDVVTVGKETLRKKVDQLLGSQPFQLQLGAHWHLNLILLVSTCLREKSQKKS